MALVGDLVLSSLTSSSEGMYKFLKEGAVVMQEIFYKLKESKTRKLLRELDEYLSTYQSVFKHLEEKEYRIALNALQKTQDAKDFLFATDMKLRVLALETIKTTEQCKKIVEVIEKNPEKTTKCCEYIVKTMKSLMERSKDALDTATDRFKELHEEINKIVCELTEFDTKLDMLKGRLEDKKNNAQKAPIPGNNWFSGLLGLFNDNKKKNEVVENYENTIHSVMDAKGKKAKTEELLKETKKEIEAAQKKLTDWITVVNINKANYDQGNHAQELIDIDPKMLKDEFDELKRVCEAYIELCNTDEKNKKETETSNETNNEKE